MSQANRSSVVALVPMRHRSQRVEGKNYRMIDGRPLYSYILETLLECKSVDTVVVDTDSPVIFDGIQKLYPEVQLIQRPDYLTPDETPMNDILLYDIEQQKADFYLQTHTTNPLLRATTIETAIETFFKAIPGKDSLFSVTPFQTRLWTPDGKAVNHDPDELIPTQDLNPLLVENSCIYLFSNKSMRDRHNRIGNHPILFEIEAEEAVDIDTEWDFYLAEKLLEARRLDARLS